MKDLHGAQVVTGFEQYMINEEGVFSTSSMFTLDSIGDTKLLFLLSTPKSAHISLSYVAIGGDAEIEIQEEPMISEGTPLCIVSRERYGDQSTTMRAEQDVTVEEDGWLIFGDIINSSRGGKKNLFVLQPSYGYLIKITAKSAGVKVALQMLWFETTD